MGKTIGIGVQDFGKIRTKDYFYIDKTDFIREWWKSGADVTLITRPRRFGKTLNMSMMQHFWSNQFAGRGDLFEGLSIWKDEAYRSLQGTYPVLFLSFAGIKGRNYQVARGAIIQTILDLYAKYFYLTESDALNPQEKEFFEYIRPDMTDEVAAASLQRLVLCLSRYYGRKVIILLDEYDTPLQEAYVYGYWNDLTAFTRSLFNMTFKTNPYLEKGLLTGITRISRESIFSDLNNLDVITTTSQKYESAFGFTEAEVMEALRAFDMTDSMEKVREWYDGFHFGHRTDIYNPWSITKFLENKKTGTYWANTSSNNLVSKLIRESGPEVKTAAEDLLSDRSITSVLDEEIVFDQMDGNPEAIWSLLLSSGYLKTVEVSEEENEDTLYHLELTNLEVKKEFQRMVRRWFHNPDTHYNDFIRALLLGDIGYMNLYMNQVALQTFSFFDSGNHPSEETEPERFYHGFVLGLIVDLKGRYLITSNRESGFGRYDVVLEPCNEQDPAVILEFKVRDPGRERSLEDTVKEAQKQIRDKRYAESLTSRGISADRIHSYGLAFEGKTVLIG
ncbi:MAG: ATP-binding protein [Lachnospiraceae bacterium]|nr:ATP-binding protein [Lachnospiraceae bacterium]